MFSEKRAFQHFTENAAAFARSSLSLVAAATVCYVAGAKDGRLTTEVTAELHNIVEGKGLGTASAYRYVGLARSLSTKLDDGVAAAVIAARSPAVAHAALAEWFTAQGLSSVDGLAASLGGAYTRKQSPPTAPSASPEAAGEPARRAAKPHDSASLAEDIESALEAGADPVKFITELAAGITDPEVLFTMADVLYDRAEALEREHPPQRRSRARVPAFVAPPEQQAN